MNMLGVVLAVLAAWAWASPKATGKWLAEVAKAYRSAFEQEGERLQ